MHIRIQRVDRTVILAGNIGLDHRGGMHGFAVHFVHVLVDIDLRIACIVIVMAVFPEPVIEALTPDHTAAVIRITGVIRISTEGAAVEMQRGGVEPFI